VVQPPVQRLPLPRRRSSPRPEVPAQGSTRRDVRLPRARVVVDTVEGPRATSETTPYGIAMQRLDQILQTFPASKRCELSAAITAVILSLDPPEQDPE
jgi:hypothetical protein